MKKMKHVVIEAFDCPDAWFQVVSKIWKEGEIFVVGHGSECTETKKLDVTIHIKHPEQLPLLNEKCLSDPKAVEEYALTYFLTDFLGEHPYTYGWRLRHPVDQIEETINAIIKNPNNRQLTMTIRIPDDIYQYKDKHAFDHNPLAKREKHDPPCLTMIDIEVLNGKINLTGYFRSWDSFGALNDNLIGLYRLLEYIVNEVNERADTNYITGEMMLHSKNCHIYQRVYPLVEQLMSQKTNRYIDNRKI
jgi:thymidylate synthase